MHFSSCNEFSLSLWHQNSSTPRRSNNERNKESSERNSDSQSGIWIVPGIGIIFNFFVVRIPHSFQNPRHPHSHSRWANHLHDTGNCQYGRAGLKKRLNWSSICVHNSRRVFRRLNEIHVFLHSSVSNICKIALGA